MISAVGLCAWGFAVFVVYQLKCALATETGQKLLDALIERLRPKP